MSNEAEILNNPTSTPAAVSTGYQRQNTNAVAGRVGMDATVVSGGSGQFTLEISGPVDVNGVLYTIDTAVDFTGLSTNRYYIYLSGSGDNLTPTIDTDPGTFDAEKNARYTAGGYRVLNWIIDYDGADAVVKRWVHPANTAGLIVDDDLEVGGDANIGGVIDSQEGKATTGELHGTYTLDAAYDAIAPAIPNIGEKRNISGGGYSTIDSNEYFTFSYAIRETSSTIRLYGSYIRKSDLNVNISNIGLTNGNTTYSVIISLSW
jgi:hypothetical protein